MFRMKGKFTGVELQDDDEGGGFEVEGELIRPLALGGVREFRHPSAPTSDLLRTGREMFTVNRPEFARTSMRIPSRAQNFSSLLPILPATFLMRHYARMYTLPVR